MKYYCLYDVVTAEYGVLFGAYNDEDVKRKLSFSQQSNPYIGDLKLFYVGEVNPDTGIFIGGELNPETGVYVGSAPRFVCNLSDIVSFNPQGNQGA